MDFKVNGSALKYQVIEPMPKVLKVSLRGQYMESWREGNDWVVKSGEDVAKYRMASWTQKRAIRAFAERYLK